MEPIGVTTRSSWKYLVFETRLRFIISCMKWVFRTISENKTHKLYHYSRLITKYNDLSGTWWIRRPSLTWESTLTTVCHQIVESGNYIHVCKLSTFILSNFQCWKCVNKQSEMELVTSKFNRFQRFAEKWTPELVIGALMSLISDPIPNHFGLITKLIRNSNNNR